MKKIINKHNSLTDALTNYSVPAEKLLNAVYYLWQEEENRNNFKVSIIELKQLIGWDANGNNDAIIGALQELTTTQSFRNFEYKGREVKYHVGSFLSSLTVYKDNVNIVEVTIDPLIISALEQRIGYTRLDLAIIEKFRTSYGLKLYQLFRRYKTQLKEKDKPNIVKTLDELNEYFVTQHKSVSKIKECVVRGLKEIEKVTGEKITFKDEKYTKTFSFFWDNEPSGEQNICLFQFWFREHFSGFEGELFEHNFTSYGLNEKGYFYVIGDRSIRIDPEMAKEYWKILYNKREMFEKQKMAMDEYKRWRGRA